MCSGKCPDHFVLVSRLSGNFCFRTLFTQKRLSADLPSVVKFKIRALDWSSVQKYQHKIHVSHTVSKD